MALDKHGVPERKIERDLFPEKKPEVVKPKKVEPVQVLISAQLKQAADLLQKAWGQHQEEQMVELDIENVLLKFTNDELRETFLDSLKKLAPLINRNFPSTHPLTKPAEHELENPHKAKGVWTGFWRKYFLPSVFDELMQDIVGTNLDSIFTQPGTLKIAQAYLDAYAMGFVRMELDVEEGADHSAVETLTNSLREGQVLFVKFLKLLVKSLPASDVHRVIIQKENKIEVDGKQSAIKGAALRALLALALLRNEAEFTVEEFAKLYHGGSVDDAKTDFDNAIKALTKELPQISSQTPSKGHRTITGITFVMNENDAVISKRLAGFYKK